MRKTFLFIVLSIIFVVGNLFADLTINFVDVGQGDAEYIVLPNGKNVLIDGGPSNTKISNFLTAHGITAIDYVVLTHPHDDHYTGLNYVFDNCQVRNFYDTRMNNTGAAGDETVRAKAASEAGCTISYPTEGDNLSWDPDVTVKVLHATPGATSSSDGTTINCSSIVLKLTYKGTSILLTGDIDSTVESNLVSTYGSGLAATVLKVAHHGSSYGSSSVFLDKVKPARAYIEVGAGNSYGHPTTDTLSRLQAAGAAIYRTDLSGTLTYTIAANSSGNDNTGNTSTSSAASVKESDYVKPAQLNFGATSGIKKKIKELKDYKDAQK